MELLSQSVTGKLEHVKPIQVDDYKFLQEVCNSYPFRPSHSETDVRLLLD
jgi:hypothetical protein